MFSIKKSLPASWKKWLLSTPEESWAAILEGFDAFLMEIEPSLVRKEYVWNTYNRFKRILHHSAYSQVQEVFMTGSFVRQTMIGMQAEVDMYVCYNYAAHRLDTPATLLGRLHRDLGSLSWMATLTPQGSHIVAEFPSCRFKIYPAVSFFRNKECFKIPTTNKKGWQYTYPRLPDRWMDVESRRQGELFRPAIKLVKQWRDTHRVDLRSFHLERLMSKALAVRAVENLAQAVELFFENSCNLLSENANGPFLLEPHKSYTYLDQYLYNDSIALASAKGQMALAKDQIKKAIYFMDRGQANVACQYWQKALGNGFRI